MGDNEIVRVVIGRKGKKLKLLGKNCKKLTPLASEAKGVGYLFWNQTLMIMPKLILTRLSAADAHHSNRAPGTPFSVRSARDTSAAVSSGPMGCVRTQTRGEFTWWFSLHWYRL